MIDDRTEGERLAWKLLGAPLYYCGECMRTAHVSEGVIKRKCSHTGEVIAPRRAILVGKGGLTPANRATQAFDKAYSAITGRTR